MTVTSIVPHDIKGRRLKVFLDGAFAFTLYAGEIKKYNIEEGEEIGDEEYISITKELLPKRVKQRAMNLLMKRDYTSKQLIKKLTEGGYTEEMANGALHYVSSYGYVDDERYAHDYCLSRMERASRRRIETDLERRGISREVYTPALDRCYEGADEDHELSMISAILEKKGYRAGEEAPDERTNIRLMSYLMRRGFTMDNIRKAMRGDTAYQD